MPWFRYSTATGGFKQAQVNVRLGIGESTGPMSKFLVDSGASLSMVPFSWIPALIRKAPPGEEVDLPVTDASGRWLRGRPVQFRIIILNETGKPLPGFPITEETVYVGTNFAHGLLGLTWFEKIGVHFQNFNDRRGPRFALYDAASFGPRGSS